MRVNTDAGNRQAITYFLDALKQDPNHAPSLAAIAECYLLEGVTYRVRPLAEAAALARQSATHALAIDEGLAAAHETDAQVKFFADWDAEGADRAYRRAIELSPSSGETRQHYAMFLVSRRRLPDAMQQMQTAVSLDPTSSRAQAALGMLWHYARSNDQAERVFRGVLETEPSSTVARFGLVRVLIAGGRFSEALSHLEELKRLNNGRLTPSHQAAIGLADAGLGRTAEARALAERLAVEDSADGPSLDAASVFGVVGDRDRALAILDQAVEQRAPKVLFLRMDPRFDSLRSDPRFTRLMTRLGFSS
jgi:adenylate cyclase